MKVLQIFIVLFIFLPFIRPCSAKDKFSHITIKDGLSQSSIKAICQDYKGYMWFGTADGLNRYDGYQIKIYPFNPSAPNSLHSSDISCLYVNPYDSILWIGSENSGIAMYDRRTDSFFSGFNHQTHTLGKTNDIAASNETTVWFATNTSGIYAFNTNDSSFVFPEFCTAPGFKNINCIESDSQGTLWLGTPYGLYKWSQAMQASNKTPEKIELFDNRKNTYIKALTFDNKRNLYIGTTNNGMIKYHPDSKKITRYNEIGIENFPHSNQINDIIVTKNQEIWFACPEGVYRMLNSGRIINYRNNPIDEESLTDNDIWRLYQDRADIIWIGSFIGGISKFDPNSNRFPKYTNFLTDRNLNVNYNNVLSICSDNQQSVWINTSGGLLKLRKEYFTSDTPGQYIEKLNIPISGTIHYDSSEGLFLGSAPGLCLLSGNGHLKSLSPEIKTQTNRQITSFNTAFSDSDGTIWFAASTGLLKYMPDNQKFKYIPLFSDTDPQSAVYSLKIEETSEGKLLIASLNGVLYEFDRHTELLSTIISPSKTDTPLQYKKIFCAIETTPGIIWYGTNYGLYKYSKKEDKLYSFLESEGLSNNVVYGVLSDDSGQIWCTTNKGLSVYSPTTNSFQNYTYHDGLQSNEFNQDAFYKTKDGSFLLGGIDGINIFNPEKIKRNDYIPPVLINRMEIQYQTVSNQTHPDILKTEISETKRIKLSYKQSTFSFEYAALCFTHPSRNKYKYILEGYDKTWIDAGNRRIASYTNVPPGNYTFKVIGSNSDFVWNETPSSILIEILPPFYKTWLFKILILTLILCAVYLTTYFRIKTIKHHKVLLEKKIEEKTKKLFLQNQEIAQKNKELLAINTEMSEKNEQLREQHQQIILQNEKLIKMAHEVEEANQARLRFFTSISHEFRTPLTLIISPLKSILQQFDSINKTQLQPQLKIAHSNASKLLYLINQLLDFRKIETGNEQLDISHFEINSLVREIASLFEQLAFENNITFKTETPSEQIFIWADSHKIEKIITNLLSNAFKYTPAGGTIGIKTKIEKGDNTPSILTISVSDSGEGIEEDKLPHIFERFYQSHNIGNKKYTGSGLGLAIAKTYIDLHNGEIKVSSKKNEGSIFSIQLSCDALKELYIPNDTPALTYSYKEAETICSSLKTVEHNEDETQDTDNRALQSNTKILVIEDNIDLGWYIKQSLSAYYHTSLCTNAEDGFSFANSQNPDLIISDVMLPGMNGLEFCQKIKNNFATSHIPVILLTALSDHEHQVSGLSSGADDYITKPFDLQLLLLKIRNKIELRQKFRQQFIDETALNFDSHELTKSDKAFLDKTIACIEKNISDASFNVDRLCEESAISHPQMYRKVKALTNLSIAEYIRSIRLKKAASILQDQSLKISDVAYSVGFSDPNYFSKCFTKAYGKTPKDYQKG